MGKKSKSKGSSFERLICRNLSLWLSDGEREDLLWRSAMSGGRATVRLSRGDSSPHISGDICAVHAEGNQFVDDFFVECKNYRDLQPGAFAFESAGCLVEFWHEAWEQSMEHEKLPLLIFKAFQRPICVATTTMAIDFLNLEHAVFLVMPHLDFNLIRFDTLTSIVYPRLRG